MIKAMIQQITQIDLVMSQDKTIFVTPTFFAVAPKHTDK
jgi:hypothetical protein